MVMDYPFVADQIRARAPHWQALDLFVTTRAKVNATAAGRETTRAIREKLNEITPHRHLPDRAWSISPRVNR
jgi:hypothetical protein